MRGLESNKTTIRHMVFTEVARYAYEDLPKEYFEELLSGKPDRTSPEELTEISLDV